MYAILDITVLSNSKRRPQFRDSFVVDRMIPTISAIQVTLNLVILSLVAVWCWYQFKNRHMLTFARKLATLEPTLPILGHILYCLPDLDGVISNFALGLSLKAASNKINAFCLWAGPKPFIVIQNPDDIQLLLNSAKSLEKGEDYRLVKFALGDGLFTAPVQLWKLIRRQIQPMFHPRNVNMMVPRLNEQGLLIAKELSEHVGQGHVNILPMISKYVVSSTGRLLLGNTSLLDLNPKSKVVEDIYKSISRSLELFSIRLVKIWLQWDVLFNWYYRKDLRHLKSTQNLTQPLVEDFRKQYIHNHSTKPLLDSSSQYLITDAFSTLIQSSPEMITEQSMCDSINNMIGAATDTTSTVLASCLLALARLPTIQDRVVDEIGSTITDSQKSDISVHDVSYLPYMDQVLKETMRRFTVAPYMSRMIVQDISTSSGVIPAGTSVYLDTFGNHMNPHIFPNPEKFDPDHFLPENIQKRSKLAFMPFSGGPRNCIGKEYAMISMKIALVHILRRFRFSTEENIEDSKFHYHATLSRVGGYPVCIEKRH